MFFILLLTVVIVKFSMRNIYMIKSKQQQIYLDLYFCYFFDFKQTKMQIFIYNRSLEKKFCFSV